MYPLRPFFCGAARRIWLVLLLVAATACRESHTIAEPPNITLLLSTTTLALQQGEHGIVTVGIARSSGFSQTVTFTATGAPQGLTASFAPDRLEDGTAISELTITASAAVPPGTYPLTLHANARGVVEQTATITVTVALGPVFGP